MYQSSKILNICVVLIKCLDVSYIQVQRPFSLSKKLKHNYVQPIYTCVPICLGPGLCRKFVWKLGLGLCDLLGLIADILLKMRVLSFDLTVLKWLLYILFVSLIFYQLYFYFFSYHIKAVIRAEEMTHWLRALNCSTTALPEFSSQHYQKVHNVTPAPWHPIALAPQGACIRVNIPTHGQFYFCQYLNFVFLAS